MTALTLRARRAAGFTLIEILVSITMLAVGIMALGTLMARGAKSANAASARSELTTILGAEAARLDAMPFTLLSRVPPAYGGLGATFRASGARR